LPSSGLQNLSAPPGPARIALVGWALLAAASFGLLLRASLEAPPEMQFPGTLAYADDFFQYLSFVEQASRGAFLFENKFDVRPHTAAFANLEWWLAGILGAGLGSPLAGFQALRLLVLGLLVAGVARLLHDAGRRGGALAWGLALVTTGGGLGWLRLWRGVPGMEIVDLRAGVYPFHHVVNNPHFLAGSALLLWTVLLHGDWHAGRAPAWPWLATGCALGLSRPFDLGAFLVLALLLAAAEVRSAGSARAARGLLPLCGFLPVLGYQSLVLGAHPSFGQWSGPQNVVPVFDWGALGWAFAPAGLLAVLGSALRSGSPPPARPGLGAWGLGLVLLLALGQTGLVPSYLLQSITTLGLALLALAAVDLPARALPWATLIAMPTSAVLIQANLSNDGIDFVPKAHFQAAEFLKRRCRPGDVLMGPDALGLVVAGLTPCRVVVGHYVLTPSFEERLGDVRRFYAADTPPAARLEELARFRARFVAVATGAGEFLGGDPRWRPSFRSASLELWELQEQRPGKDAIQSRTRASPASSRRLRPSSGIITSGSWDCIRKKRMDSSGQPGTMS
jgi:hypothetical protein